MPTMTNDDAIRIAQDVALREGWRWCWPATSRRRRRFLFWGPRRWEVRTNPQSDRDQVRILIDDATGEVCSQSYSP